MWIDIDVSIGISTYLNASIGDEGVNYIIGAGEAGQVKRLS